MQTIDTREAWLGAALHRITAGWPTQAELPENVRVSVGYPRVTRGRAADPVTFYSARQSSGGMIEVFVSPALGDALAVCRELALAAARIATGRPAGDPERAVLMARAERVAATLPPYPHDALNAVGAVSAGPGETGSRYLKTCCPSCGYSMRVTRKWLAVAMPQCPAGHGTMAVEVSP